VVGAGRVIPGSAVAAASQPSATEVAVPDDDDVDRGLTLPVASIGVIVLLLGAGAIREQGLIRKPSRFVRRP
jgi:hypothetical protein